MNLRRLLRRWREFWQSIPFRAYGSFIPDRHDDVVRLHSSAPTQIKKPLDYDVEPPPV